MADNRAFYQTELRRLNSNLRALANPEGLALKINKRLAKEGPGNGGKFLEVILQERFKKQATQGKNWKKLARATQKQRVRQGFGGASPILRRSETLARAYVLGKTKGTATGITLTPKDPLSPIYKIPKFRQKKKKKKGKARRVRISKYTGALNRVRPFAAPFSTSELQPLIKRRNEIIQQIIVAVSNNQAIGSVL